MAVYIFPVNLERIDPILCLRKIERIVKTKKDDVNYRETAKKVFIMRRTGEVEAGESRIWVDPELGFKAEDIAEDFSFGNGATIGAVRLKNGRWVRCAFIVVDHSVDISDRLETLKKLFKGIK